MGVKSKVAAGAAVLIVGAAGLGLTQVSEGKVNKAYLDPANIVTICYGHTGPEVKLGQVKTNAQCDAILIEDIKVHRAGVLKCTSATLNQNQLDAVVDLTFNIGVSAYCKSTLARKLNANDYAGAAAEFPKWNKATVKGQLKVLPGLTVRRGRERQLFETPYGGEGSAVQARFEWLVRG